VPEDFGDGVGLGLGAFCWPRHIGEKDAKSKIARAPNPKVENPVPRLVELEVGISIVYPSAIMTAALARRKLNVS
jgi:hypothetical protein